MKIAFLLIGLVALGLLVVRFRGRPDVPEDTTPAPPSPEDLGKMEELASDLQEIMGTLGKGLKPGISTKELNDQATKLLKAKGMEPSMLGYNGFPAALAVSKNDEVLHGIPKQQALVQEGDLITLQLSAKRDGVHAAMGWTFPVGRLSPERQKLISAGEKALEQGVLKAKAGARIGDIGAAIQGTVEEAGFGVVRDFVGYGIGRRLITEPQVPCDGVAGRGPKLSPPQVLHLHVIAAQKSGRVEILEDYWTAVTADGGASVLFTAMVNIEGDGTRMTFNPMGRSN